MTPLEIKLKEQIIETLNLDENDFSSLNRDMLFFADGLGLDSVDALEIMMMLRREYDIKVQTEERETVFANFGAFADFVQENRGRDTKEK